MPFYGSESQKETLFFSFFFFLRQIILLFNSLWALCKLIHYFLVVQNPTFYLSLFLKLLYFFQLQLSEFTPHPRKHIFLILFLLKYEQYSVWDTYQLIPQGNFKKQNYKTKRCDTSAIISESGQNFQDPGHESECYFSLAFAIMEGSIKTWPPQVFMPEFL